MIDIVLNLQKKRKVSSKISADKNSILDYLPPTICTDSSKKYLKSPVIAKSSSVIEITLPQSNTPREKLIYRTIVEPEPVEIFVAIEEEKPIAMLLVDP